MTFFNLEGLFSRNSVAIFIDLWYVCWRRKLVYMTKLITAGIGDIACVALCAAGGHRAWRWRVYPPSRI